MEAAHAQSAPAGSFGGRFVAELQRLSGTQAFFRYKLIQDLRRSDRERMIRVLRQEMLLSTSYSAIQRIRRAESPEQLARETWEQRRGVEPWPDPGWWFLLSMLG